MPFGFFRQQCSPVLADFGASGVKLLQLSRGEPEQTVAAATIEFDDALRGQPLEARLAYVETQLAQTLRTAGFRGKRVVVAPFTQHTLVQHVAVAPSDAECADDIIRTRIAVSLGCDPSELVVRTSVVTETMRDSEVRVETIAFAMARQDVMRYVSLFKRVGWTVVGVHSHIAALVHAFDGDARSADTATMYADLGYGGTKVAICHGKELVFAKTIPFAGRSLDARLAAAHGGEVAEIRNARMAAGLAAWNPSESVDFAEAGCAVLGTSTRASVATAARDAVDGLVEELSMCARYHGALFPEQPIDRAVFVGGESRDQGLCRALADTLGIPVDVGDPLASTLRGGVDSVSGLPEPNSPHPGWTVAYGLARTTTDL